MLHIWATHAVLVEILLYEIRTAPLQLAKLENCSLARPNWKIAALINSLGKIASDSDFFILAVTCWLTILSFCDQTNLVDRDDFSEELNPNFVTNPNASTRNYVGK